jgi:glycosyltransferase involved in cell wall biosynthesis
LSHSRPGRRCRVLLVSPVPPPIAGVQRYAVDILGSDLSRSHDIELFSTAIPWEWRPKVLTERHTMNPVKRDGLRASLRVTAWAARGVLDLHRSLRHGRYDLMHVLSVGGVGFYANGVRVAVARRRRVPTIFHLLGQVDDLYRDASPRMKRLISYFLDQADIHIVQSPGLADYMRTATTKPIYHIFNGVRVAELAPPDGFSHSDGSLVEVLSVASLGYRKGTFDLLDAAAALKDRCPQVRFTLVGGGEVDRFRALVKERGLEAQVIVKGMIEDSERNGVLHGADVFALPSHAEGQPIAILEAMAAGLPIISTTVGSIPEVVGPRNGFVIRPGDVEALVTSVETLAGSRSLRQQMGQFNACEAAQKYTLDRVMREIDGMYSRVLSGLTAA